MHTHTSTPVVSPSWIVLVTSLLLSLPSPARVLDDFNDNTKTGWADFTFIPGFGVPTESGGQFRFEQPKSPTDRPIFSASQKVSETLELKEGRTIEMRVDVVEGNAKDSFAVLAFIPTAGTGGPASLKGYGLAKSTTDVLITKGIGQYFVADDGTTAELKQDNVTLVLRLTARNGNVTVRAQILDKANNDAVIWDRTVVDTPRADVMADGTDDPPAPFLTTGYFTLYLYQDLDNGAVEDPYRAVYDNARVFITESSVLDDFNDNTKTGWTDFTFIPGFGLPTEAGGQFRFEQPPSPTGEPLFTASQKVSRPFELKEGEEIEFRATVVEGNAKDSFAVLAFIPTAGTGGPASLKGYGLAKSTTDVLITKGIGQYFVADDGPTAELKQDNITLVLRLTASDGSVTVVAQILDRAAEDAVLWERRVVDTPRADVMADGRDDPPAPFLTSGYFTLYLYQDFDRGAVEEPYRAIYDDAVVAAAPTRQSPPVLENIRPADTANFLPATTRVEFKVSDDQPLVDDAIAVVLNGVRHTRANGLTLTGTGTSREVALGGLVADTDYAATLEVTDNEGLVTRRTLHFDTFGTGLPVIEIEDYNYGGGQFINNPTVQAEGSGPDSTGYSGQVGVPEVDFLDTRTSPNGQNTPWRPEDPVRMERSRDFERARQAAAGGAGAGFYDYVVGDIAAGEWLQYTRTFTAGAYEVYLRQSVANHPTAESVLELVTGDPSAPNAATRVLGSFLAAQSGFVYRNWPLTDGSGSRNVILRLSGRTTLRLRQVTADTSDASRMQNYLLFLPVADPGVQRATVSALTPAANTTVDTVHPRIEVVIQNRDTTVNVASVKLALNGTPAAGAQVQSTPDGATLMYAIDPLPPAGATNIAVVTFQDSENVEVRTEWQFVVSYASLDPATRINGTGRERGFRMRVVQAPQENGALENSLERAEQQLAANSTIPRFVDTNLVVQLVNFNKRPGENAGNFEDDQPVPGIDVDANGDNDFSTELVTFLELPAGAHRMGVVTDDGYKLASGAMPVGAGTPAIAFHNGGPANETFDFVVPVAGIYPFRLVWYERGGAGHGEWFSVNPASGERTLVNGSGTAAIKAWHDVQIQEPGVTLHASATVAGPYAPEPGASVDAANRTVTVPAPAAPRFYRLNGGTAVRIQQITLQGGTLTLRWQ